MADTRKDKRAPVSLKVRFKSATVDEFIEQYCRDVSRGGIFINSKQPMPVGTLLKFQLQLKDESSLIKGVGRVVWTRSEDDASGEAPAGMGIKFIKMDGESRVVVDRIVGGHDGKLGTFEQGEVSDGAGLSDAPPSKGSEGAAGGFFPNLPPAVLPPPEDRTAVRHAAQFLASALSESGTDAAASREAQQKADEAQRRTTQIQAQRIAEAEQKKKAQSGEALPSMIIDPSLSIPPPPPPAAHVDEDRPTHTDPRRAPTSDGPTGHKEKPKAKAASKSVPRPAVSEPPLEDTGITDRQKVDLASFAAAADRRQAGAKKSNALPYFVIAAVVAVAAYLALQSDKEQVVEEPVVTEPAAPQTPEPVEPAPVPEPAPVAEPEPDPAPAPEPVVLVAVKVATTPNGAEIFVGNESRGKAPLTLELPEGAPVTIRARSVGRAEATLELTPESGQKPLKLALGALPYVLHVDTSPPGASVSVGVKRGVTPVDFELPGAPKGPLKITARLAGHESGTAIVAASSFEEREGALRSSVALTLNENKVAAPTPQVASKPKPKPRPIAKPEQPTAAPAEVAPKPAEVTPVPKPEAKPVEPAPKPVEAAPAPKPVEAAPKPAVKPKVKPEVPAKPKPEPGSEPIPDNPFG